MTLHDAFGTLSRSLVYVTDIALKRRRAADAATAVATGYAKRGGVAYRMEGSPPTTFLVGNKHPYPVLLLPLRLFVAGRLSGDGTLFALRVRVMTAGSR